MQTQISESDLLVVLQNRLKSAGSQRKLGAELGVSGQFLNDVLKGRRLISDTLAEKLGYKRNIVFFKDISFSPTEEE